MKKARIFLASLGVLAVLGGALAFKAKTGHFFVFQLNSGGTQCALITDPNSGVPITYTDDNTGTQFTNIFTSATSTTTTVDTSICDVTTSLTLASE